MYGQDIIIDILKYLYRKDIEKFFEKLKDNEEKEEIIYVTDLCGCSNKYYLLKRFGYSLNLEDLSKDFMKSFATIGTIFHIGIQKILEEIDNEYMREVQVERTYNINNKRVKLKGRVDILDNKNNVIIEIKFVMNPNNIPRENHILQLKIYMNLLNIDNGLLIYITPSGIKYYEVFEKMDDGELLQLIKKFIQNKNIIKQCKYCPFRKICMINNTDNQNNKSLKDFINP